MRVVPAAARGTVSAPSSKSYTHRALVAGFLSGRTSRVRSPLDSDDTRATAEALRRLGAEVRLGRGVWTVRPSRSPPAGGRRTIRCGSSGTTLRFLVAVAGLRHEPVRFVGSAELAARPLEPLLAALERSGVRVARIAPSSSLPVDITGPMRAGRVWVDARASSQFVSALLLVLPTLDGPTSLRVGRSRVSAPYVAATLDLMERQGVPVDRIPGGYTTLGGRSYRGGTLAIPGDASSAAYLWAAAVVSGGTVRVRGIPSDRPQADLAILDVLKDSGAQVLRSRGTMTVAGRLSRPITIDLDDTPDLLPLLSAVAAVTPGRHRLSGAAHARWKESDRRFGSAQLGRFLGARVDTPPGTLVIHGSDRPRSFRHLGWTDHRLVMSGAVGALASRTPSTLGNANSVRKSYPGFWRDLRALGVRCERAT
jgi:3-phosphoshikimate 1-carboxyvinyltransferase